jgi:hypothetical protein
MSDDYAADNYEDDELTDLHYGHLDIKKSVLARSERINPPLPLVLHIFETDLSTQNGPQG